MFHPAMPNNPTNPDSLLLLSHHESTPMYTQIVNQIVTKVTTGDWAPGRVLPSIRELASTSGVSVITVKRAYLELERAGIIITRQGKGSYIADTRDLQRQLTQDDFHRHLLGMLDAAKRLGMERVSVMASVDAALAADANGGHQRLRPAVSVVKAQE